MTQLDEHVCKHCFPNKPSLQAETKFMIINFCQTLKYSTCLKNTEINVALKPKVYEQL